MTNTIERFWKKVDKQPNGCWVWQASKTKDGYGKFFAWGTMVIAHRFSYEIHQGPIPPYRAGGLQLDHKICSMPACVNPEHLRLVTFRENILRSKNFSAKNARKVYCSRGHMLEHKNLLKTKNGTRQCRICRNIRNRKQRRTVEVGSPNLAIP